MTHVDYEDLDERYAALPKREKFAPSTKPVGSLTENRRQIKPSRDGAHKRDFQLNGER
jgi:hypothetical protein